MSHISTTNRNDLNNRLEHLVLLGLFEPDEVQEIYRAAAERGISATTLIRQRVLGSISE